ncbi:hypothetical protein [Candidatus Pantoea multigeneris]|uniref:Uncharacterized protein n=1 Tax=Candidatus Pantoea multigeneris TaxID=2608357 RepID=A0ABX0RJ94_9GAMM|nr:hypothetical protein [Pantoea multigeneris]NIF23709.1 hypothetical protein [Pantoea multigeneris]
MNPLNAITFAALCGPLAQPAALALDFIPESVTTVTRCSQKSPSLDDYANSLEQGKETLSRLTISIDDYYISLIKMDFVSARQTVVENGIETMEACEMFLRAFEEEIKKTISGNLPGFVATELRIYWRHIAKARSSVTRLNQFTLGLFKDAVTYKSTTDLSAVKELAAYTSTKLKEAKFH